MARIPSKQEILEWVAENPSQASKRDIAKAFGIKGADRIGLKAVLRELQADGALDQHAVDVHSLSDVDKFDLSLSGLRWPPTPSLERLRRIGATACLTQGIQYQDRIWGYLAFLHRSARSPNHRTRLALSHLQPLIASRLCCLKS